MRRDTSLSSRYAMAQNSTALAKPYFLQIWNSMEQWPTHRSDSNILCHFSAEVADALVKLISR